jgi:hypothetical protein
MKHGKNFIRSYMTFSVQFTGLRIQDGFLTPVDWLLSVNLIVRPGKNKSKQEVERKAGLIYQRLNFWLDANLQSVVVVDVNSEDDLYIANLSSNITMYCPASPSDDLLIQMLHSKMTALTGPELEIGEIKLNASDTAIEYTFDVAETGYSLPETTEYYPDGKCRDTLPWWSRNDGFCFEFVNPEKEGACLKDFYADVVDPMDEFERVLAEMTETDIGIGSREPARIVQVEKWKPKKVE